MKIKTIQFLIITVFSLILSCSSSLKTVTIKSEDVLKLLDKEKDIYLSNKTITGDLDFTKVKKNYPVSKQLIIAEVSNSVTFVDCKFEGKIIGFSSDSTLGYSTNFEKNLSFVNCEFLDEVNFRQVTINGVANFSQSIFNSKVTFEGAVFYSAANYFVETIYRDEVKFTKSTFYGYTSFLKSVFEKIAYFKKSTFYGEALFNACNFYGYTDFSSINTLSDFSINSSVFTDEVYFNYAVFQKDAEFNKIQTDTLAEFKEIIFKGNTKFNNSTFKNGTTFKNSYFTLGYPQTNDITKGDLFIVDSCFSLTKIIIITENF
jgi:hypothetical protein